MVHLRACAIHCSTIDRDIIAGAMTKLEEVGEEEGEREQEVEEEEVAGEEEEREQEVGTRCLCS